MQRNRIKIINKILKNSDMEIKLNESQILQDAWDAYLQSYLKGWKWSVVYNNTRVEARNEAIRQMWKNEADTKRKAEAEKRKAEIIASGMDLHTYAITSYYNSYGYKGD